MGQIFNRKIQKPTRKLLRNSIPDVEKILWSKLKGSQLHGFKFRRQHGIGPFVVDFYCPSANLIIEVDGATHSTSDEIAQDKMRE
ncbi:MAG TPA: endonuclease domain-containing protein, partial [Bacteroidota bacterium]|nr:endonuclease domain-containing protein [Bacteroidota bacterium]